MKIFPTYISSIIFFTISQFVLANANPTEPSSLDKRNSFVYAELNYLLWFTNQDELHCPTVATGSSPILNSNWNSGLRATFGLQSSYWDTLFSYTYYSTNPNAKATENREAILTSYPSTAGIFEVGTKWSLNFNRIDWEFGRKITFDHYVLKPFFGIEGLDISQKFTLNTNTAFIYLINNLPATNIVETKNKNMFLGLGARAGFDTHFYLGSGFEFYSTLAGSILAGAFRIKEYNNETDYYSSGGSSVLIDQIRRITQNGSIFNCDLGLGFNWMHYFQRKKLELLIKCGWEQHYYTDIIRFQDFYLQQISLGTAAYSSNGNLSLSGFTFGIQLGY